MAPVGRHVPAPAEKVSEDLYDPFDLTPFSSFLKEWRAGESSCDPFENLIAYYRAEAAYLEHERGDLMAATQARRFAERLERVIEEVLDTPVSYQTAGMISVWSYGTIKNRAADGLLPTEAGRVRLRHLPIGPTTKGLQALRAAEELTPSQPSARGRRAPKSEHAKRMYDRGRRSNGGRRSAG